MFEGLVISICHKQPSVLPIYLFIFLDISRSLYFTRLKSLALCAPVTPYFARRSSRPFALPSRNLPNAQSMYPGCLEATCTKVRPLCLLKLTTSSSFIMYPVLAFCRFVLEALGDSGNMGELPREKEFARLSTPRFELTALAVNKCCLSVDREDEGAVINNFKGHFLTFLNPYLSDSSSDEFPEHKSSC